MSETIEVQSVVTETSNELAAYVSQTGLDAIAAKSLQQGFAPLFDQATKWRRQAADVRVTDVSQVREMKLARELRLAIKDTRVSSDRLRKAMKEGILRQGKAIDGCHAVIEFICAPIEEDLLKQEKFAEEQEKARVARLTAERTEAVAPYDANIANFYRLGEMADADWNALFETVKRTFETKVEQARLAEEARKAALAAEEVAKAAQAAENDRLQAEVEETKRLAKEAAAQAVEQAKVAKRAADAEARRLRIEKEAAEEVARQAKAASELKAKRELDEAEDRARQAARQAELEMFKAHEVARKANAARIEAEAKTAEMEAAAKELIARADAAAKFKAAAKAQDQFNLGPEPFCAAATDKERILAFADRISQMIKPELSTEDGKECFEFVLVLVNNTVETIKAAAKRL